MASILVMDKITAIRSALKTRKGEWPAICERTGLSYWWLIKFAQGRIKEPGHSKIARLELELFGADGVPNPTVAA